MTRSRLSLNAGWLFHKGEPADGRAPAADAGWLAVTLPHTWNAEDLPAEGQGGGTFAGYGMVGATGYYRGPCWYRRTLRLSTEDAGHKLYLHFDGANQDAVVTVNGREAGRHLGGYTAFRVDITDFVRHGVDNDLAVRLSNAPNEDVPPVGGDLGHFGGLYRHVYLDRVPRVHFEMDDYASPGVFVDTPEVSGVRATVRVRTRLANETGVARRVRLVSRLVGQPGAEPMETACTLAAGATVALELRSAPVARPRLWSPDDPHTCRVHHALRDADTGALLDELDTPLGFRWFAADPDRGFLLNGARCFLRGIGRHQDRAGIGYAVPYEALVEDTQRVKELGCNAMRGHYPLVGEVYDACDRLGILCWVKVVIMDRANLTPAFEANTLRLLREMLLQLHNHPSIALWGHACEALGDADWFWPKPIDPAKLRSHFEQSRAFFERLERETRALDPPRLTANDFHTDPHPEWYAAAGLTAINTFNAWNLYQGWYHANLENLPAFLDRLRAFAPHRPFLIAEYGAGTDTRIQAPEPTIYDFSPEYAERFHQAYLAAVAERPWIAGMFIWTLADFQRTALGDTMKHTNNKGMLTGDRRPKDTFYLYKARWNPAPGVHIALHDAAHRVAVADADGGVAAPVHVYASLPEVELFSDGTSLGVRRTVDGLAAWRVRFGEGTTRLRAVARHDGRTVEDAVAVDYRLVPPDLRTGVRAGWTLCVNVGQTRTCFRDPLTDNRWLPDRPYAPGGFGFLDGATYTAWPTMPAWHGRREGIGANIARTELEPVFQTFRLGVTRYRFDVPDGRYRVTLCFAEPFTRAERLDASRGTGADAAGRRTFDVLLNGQTVLEALDLAGHYGERTAVMEQTRLAVRGDDGLLLVLRPRHGLPVLSGVALWRE